MNFLSKTFLILIFGLMFFTSAYAQFTSTNFQLENPINIIEGGQATSSSFRYFSTTGQIAGGQSTSASFAQNAGFLYFPTATSPIVQTTAGDAQVTLSWTAAIGTLANVTSYTVGISASSGGSFTYTDVGGVLTSIRTGLTNGIPYFFKIRSYAAGILLSESAEVSSTPVASPSGGGGGGGGGGYVAPVTSVVFSGRAYPLSRVTILKDGQIAVTTIAGPDSNFIATLSGLSTGNYTFAVYGEDKNNIRSSLFTFPIYITSGATTTIGGIFIAPTITVDKSEVKRGDNIAIFGQSAPISEITISINSEEEIFVKKMSDTSGAYLLNFDTSILTIGQHSAKSKAALNGEISSFSKVVGFAVSTKNVLAKEPTKCPAKADLNSDCRVNLVDFSIAAYWYKRPLSATFKLVEAERLNGDGKVNLVDFSIMAYFWTG